MNDKNEEAGINQQAIFDIINNIQEKMGSNGEKQSENVHINEVSNDKTSSSINNSTPSLQNILGNLDMGKISGILGSLGMGQTQNSNDNNTNTSSTSTNNGEANFDINTILKMQKIMSRISKDDPKKNLLMSLKPFLRKTRQDKLDTYMGYLTIWNVIGMFSEGSDIL